MIAALNRMEEWDYRKGAIKNGVTKGEMQATIHHISIYCGIGGLNCQRIAKRVHDELEAAE